MKQHKNKTNTLVRSQKRQNKRKRRRVSSIEEEEDDEDEDEDDVKVDEWQRRYFTNCQLGGVNRVSKLTKASLTSDTIIIDISCLHYIYIILYSSLYIVFDEVHYLLLFL